MRTWLYETLRYESSLSPTFGPDPDNMRIYPRESLDSSVVEHPYLVYGMGNNTNENLAEDDDHMAERQFFQVWIHDKKTAKGGSYVDIDNAIPLVKAALVGKGNKELGILRVNYLETSAEFSSEALNTLFRYIRFQAIFGKVLA